MAVFGRPQVIACLTFLACAIVIIGIAVSGAWANDPDSNGATPSFPFDQDNDGWMTETELRLAVSGTRDQLRFPQGVVPTGNEMVDRFLADLTPAQRASSNFEVGYEWTVVGNYHRCSWEREFLIAHASNDRNRSHLALDALEAAMPRYRIDESREEYFANMIHNAEKGDTIVIRNDVELNCGTYTSIR